MFSRYTDRKTNIFHLNYSLICVCSIIVLFISSCQKNLTIEINTNDKRLLVNGEFTNDSVIHQIELYCSESLITGLPQTVVSGAKIYVTDKTDTFLYIENKDTLGLYQTPQKCCGKGGRTYFLSISNIDIDQDGQMDSYTANSIMPVPVVIDSIVSKRGLDGDKHKAVINLAYYKIKYKGPDYAYPFIQINGQSDRTIAARLGTGELSRLESDYKTPKVKDSNSEINRISYVSSYANIKSGDTISFVCYNFTSKQFGFLKEFDNNANGDPFLDNMFDQLKIPSNVLTNIEPENKAAGYFFVYSISSISKVFNE